MRKPSFRDKTLALAGVFQAAGLVDSLAWHGHCDPLSLEASLKSLLVPLQPSMLAMDFYGQDLRHLFSGFQAMEQTLAPTTRHPPPRQKTHPRQKDVLRYALTLIYLERQLAKNPTLQAELKRRLDMSHRQLAFFREMKDPGMMRSLSGSYVDTVGKLKLRIQVKGSQKQLQTAGMPEQVRAVLLSGIHAASLWHQLGGRRWQLAFTRGKIVRELRQLISETSLSNKEGY